MTQQLLALAVASASVLLLIQTVRPLSGFVRDRRTRWTTLALIALIGGGLLGDTTFLSGSAPFKLAYSGLFIALLFGTVALRSDPVRRHVSVAPILLLLALWGYLFLVNVYQNSGLGTAVLFTRLVPGIIWVMVLVLWRHTPITRQLLATVSSACLALPGMLTLVARDPWRACDAFKCGVFGGMLTGPYTSENYVAQQVVIVTALSLVAYGIRASLPVLVLGTVWLLATESRTSQYAFIAGLGVMIVFTLLRKAVVLPTMSRPGALRWLIASVSPLAFIALGVNFALTAEPTDFSNRGLIWIRSLRYIEESRIIGQGIDRWPQLQQLGLLSEHYPHSLYVFVLFSGGVVGLVLLFLWLRQSLVTGMAQDGRLRPVMMIGVVFMTLALLEVVWNPLAVDGTSWFPLTLIAISWPPQTRRTLV
mgnify:CR=1 FL=1